MIKIKKGVELDKMSPQILLGLIIADQQNDRDTTWVTSISDDAPGRLPNSKHKTGDAVDLRISNIPDPEEWVEKIKMALGEEFDVVLESSHIHLERDPKKN